MHGYTVLNRFDKNGEETEPLPTDEFIEEFEEHLKNWNKAKLMVSDLLRERKEVIR